MSDLRERVARAKYEEKRARLLEAFGDTAGWPEWDNLKQTLKEIEMEEHDAAIAIVLEEAARVAEREGVYPALNVYNGGPEWYRHGKDIAAAIRALAKPSSGASSSAIHRHAPGVWPGASPPPPPVTCAWKDRTR